MVFRAVGLLVDHGRRALNKFGPRVGPSRKLMEREVCEVATLTENLIKVHYRSRILNKITARVTRMGSYF